mgnify:FL=1
MTAEEYRNYLEQDFSDVDINEMTDLRMIKADRNKSAGRISEYMGADRWRGGKSKIICADGNRKWFGDSI